jgi:hypothetical protein
MKVTFTVVANGSKAWEAAMGQVQEVEGDKLDYVVNQVYTLNVSSLVPLLADKEYKLAPVAEKDVNGKKAVGVKVIRGRTVPVSQGA